MVESTAPQGLTRRTVAKGAAWAVPVIAVVTPTHAMAASNGVVSFTGKNCKLPGSSSVYNNGAVYLATISNTTNAAITITIVDFTRGAETTTIVGVVKLSTQPSGDLCCVDLTAGADDTFTVAANSTGTYAIITKDFGNSANNSVSLRYKVNGGPTLTAPGQDGGLNPIAGGNCGSGGSCNALTDAQKACVLKAIGQCATASCS
ncbi:MAG: hypothetical protein ABIQ61_02695 [Ornithinibacter sp.]